MAVSLVNTMADKWDPGKYHDEYRECLMKVIEEKIEAGPRKLPAPKKGKAQPKVVDLVSLLEKSLQQNGKRQKPKRAQHAPAHTQRKAA